MRLPGCLFCHLQKLSLVLGLLLFSQAVFAHISFADEDDNQVTGLVSRFLNGSLNEYLSAVLLVGYWILYSVGSWRQPPHRVQMLFFHLGSLMCVLALLGPLDKWAATNAAAHMTQHMMLMVVVAPLWVLSGPLPQIAAGGGKFNAAVWEPMLRLTHYPLFLAYLHGAVIWFWHMPFFYTLALENPWWHSVEHACFLGTAVLFWWAVLRSAPRKIAWALLAVLLTLMHTGFLGAVLTFANEPLYGAMRPLADQQLAGLIMWVVGAIPYMMASMWIGYRWYQQLLRRMNAAVY